MTACRVFYVVARDPRPALRNLAPGWYWRTEEPHGEPNGPFDNAIDAGRAARAAVIEMVEEKEQEEINDGLDTEPGTSQQARPCDNGHPKPL